MYVLESWSHLPSQAARHQPQWEPRGYRSFGQEIERNAISAEHNFISLVLCTIFTNFDFVRLQMVRFSPVVLLVYVMLMFLCYYKHQICRSIEDIHYSGTGSRKKSAENSLHLWTHWTILHTFYTFLKKCRKSTLMIPPLLPVCNFPHFFLLWWLP